jgi:UDP-N-acetylglucosamine transferase subunit ALG13
VIFVTVGTNEAPFDRLVSGVSGLAGREEVVVQHGASAVRPEGATCIGFLPFDELVELVRRARVVVTHAGVGSIMVALSQGKRPIVVPRLGRFGEAVDDHQVPFARRLSERGLVTVVDDPSLLPAAIDDAHAPVELESTGRLGLAQDLATYLRTLVDGAEPSGPMA